MRSELVKVATNEVSLTKQLSLFSEPTVLEPSFNF